MDGQVLCNLGKERFLELAPDFVGDILWEHLEQMIKGTRPPWEGGRRGGVIGSLPPEAQSLNDVNCPKTPLSESNHRSDDRSESTSVQPQGSRLTH